ncbi:MAG: glycosyltransferase family 4 protein [Cyanobacteriota bacterium]|nr:glycosyltransferase family 4 protein [Cyanobacteriota bacterium]
MKILVVSNEADRTGAPAIALDLIKWLKDHYPLEAINVLMRDGALRREFELIGKTYTWTPTDLNQPERLYKRLGKLLLQRKHSDPGLWLMEILEREQPDIIYLSTLVLGKYLQQAKKLLGQRVVSHVHELLPSLRQLSTDHFVQTQLALSDAVIACAPCVAETLFDTFHLPPGKCTVIPEYIVPQPSDTKFTAATTAEGLTGRDREVLATMQQVIQRGGPIFGVGGNPIHRKGFDLFPLLIKECKRQFANTPFHAIWIGCGEGSAAHGALDWDLKRLGLEDDVTLIPSVSLPVFRWILSQLNVLTLLSREDPFPLVVLEAGMLGVPTVCFEGSGAIPELADEGCCQSVNYLDLPAFAEAVHRLCLNADAASQMAARCQQKVRQDLCLDKVAPQVAAVLLGPSRQPLA